MIPAGLREQALAWAADDPDLQDQDELHALIDAAGTPGEPGTRAAAEIRDRFAGRLVFGTAGLRGAMGAGPNRMNRAVVRAATAALAGWLAENRPGAASAGVVVGCDARHRSAQFADETAAVLTGAGMRVHLLPRPSPTPLLAFAVRYLAAAAGVMITASHNPPADNGYKLYLADGAQIVPPVDAGIEARIASLGGLSRVRVGPLEGPLVTRHGGEVASSYLAAVIAAVPPPPPGPARDALRIVYTPLHGVAGSLAVQAITQAGFPPPQLVAAQAEPDADFPTVAFPNPEEPGALDLALEQASRAGADLVIASDPDGDRLAVAVPAQAQGGSGWRVLTGDQVGALLGAFLLERTDGAQRLVATTVVSSTMLSKVAAAAGARYAQTLTGFKWIVRAGEQVPGARLVFGYEEALGYAVTPAVVRDKDGIGAALGILSLVASARAAGESLLDRWDVLEAAHGVHLTAHVTVPSRAPSQIMARLRASPPRRLGGTTVTAVTDLAGGSGPMPPADVLCYGMAAARAVIRPSGTEPKLKAYLEVVEELSGRPLAVARQAAAARLTPLRAAVTRLMTADGDQAAASGP